MTTESERTADDRPVVMAVDDEERVVQAFDIWLGDEYRTLTATSGTDALEAMDDSVDVVLLDRHMPGLSGDEVLERIREEGYDCRVAMVTGVDPDFDIIEMSFEEYIQKPLDEQKLRDVVEELLTVRGYDETVEELYSISRKRATLEAEKSPQELDDSDEYAELVDRQEALEAETDAMMDSLDHDEATALFRGPDS